MCGRTSSRAIGQRLEIDCLEREDEEEVLMAVHLVPAAGWADVGMDSEGEMAGGDSYVG